VLDVSSWLLPEFLEAGTRKGKDGVGPVAGLPDVHMSVRGRRASWK